MMRRLVNGLRGQVTLRVESPFPERILNLCGEHGIAFWDLSWEGENCFACRITRRWQGERCPSCRRGSPRWAWN